jgi:hypothetical protein
MASDKDKIVWVDTSTGDVEVTLPPLSCTCEGGQVEIQASGPNNVEIKSHPADGGSAIEDLGDEALLNGPARQWVALAPIVESPTERRWRTVDAGFGPAQQGIGGPLIYNAAMGIYGFNSEINPTGTALLLPGINLYVDWVSGTDSGTIGAPFLTSTGSRFTLGAQGIGAYRAFGSCKFATTLAATITFAIIEPISKTPLPGAESSIFLPAATTGFLNVSGPWFIGTTGSQIGLAWKDTVLGNSLSIFEARLNVAKVGL